MSKEQIGEPPSTLEMGSVLPPLGGIRAHCGYVKIHPNDEQIEVVSDHLYDTQEHLKMAEAIKPEGSVVANIPPNARYKQSTGVMSIHGVTDGFSH